MPFLPPADSVKALKAKDKHIKIKSRIYVLFVFDLDGECKFIKKRTL